MILFALDARATDAGAPTWGGFKRLGAPVVQELGGQKAVLFDGKKDGYEGPGAPAELSGSHPRTIEVWAWRDRVTGDEDTLVAWGKRGGPVGTDMSLNWGNNGAYGGVTHWSADMGWQTVPQPGQWHHLVYTYDGRTARLYDNGVERNHLALRLSTPLGSTLRIAAQNAASGAVAFTSEYGNAPLSGPFALATLRLHDVALSPAEVKTAFEQDRARFKAVAPLTVESLREKGVTTVAARGLTLTLSQADGTPLGLVADAAHFDFLPTDRLLSRLGDGFHHLGDLLLRVRAVGESTWQSYDTAMRRGAAPPESFPLTLEKRWRAEGGALVLRYTLTNRTDKPVELGAVGLPVVFNNIISERNLEQAHESCVFFDPYLGLDAGYLQVTRLTGKGPALVVLPEGQTPFEAYLPLNEPLRPSQTFEGTFAWLAHSAAYAENEWRNANPWNPPTKATLKPGESRTYGLRFALADGVRQIEKTVSAAGRPVAVGVPGYIVPQGADARLILNYSKPVKSVAVEPKGALTFRQTAPTPAGGKTYALQAKGWGRARVTVTYADGLVQTVHYWLTKPAPTVVGDLGRFLFTKQWFEKPGDPFGRSPSVLSYDREANQMVEQDSRVWIAGLGDEGGSGSWLAAAMKLYLQPEKQQVAQFERFVDGVLWGGLQYKDGPNKYGVRKSLFYYDPKILADFPYRTDLDWRSWTSWSKRATEDIGRGYNYPHVVAAYWSLYRVARNHGLTTHHDWRWYLEQAFQTAKFLFSGRVGYADLGLMEGTVFRELLLDLKHEGWQTQAQELERLVKRRADRWKQEAYPFGSEMAWDSTGQEEVYAWCRYFGYLDKADVSLNSILGYMPTVAHWGYNGNARRYWDFLYGGKLSRIERQLHHYGSGMNALPVLTAFRDHPDDTYLLRVGYGGMMGPLSNIDQEGFASAAFHSFPSTLKWDAYSGDYGPNFFGHALNVGCYVVNDPALGWQAFGGALTQKGSTVTIVPQDSLRQRVFIAPLKLWLTLDAGQLERVSFDTKAKTVTLQLAAKPAKVLLRIEGGHRPGKPFPTERGGWLVPTGAPLPLLPGR